MRRRLDISYVKISLELISLELISLELIIVRRRLDISCEVS